MTPALDSRGGPKEFYGRRVHDTVIGGNTMRGCCGSFDDEKLRASYCLYDGLPRSVLTKPAQLSSGMRDEIIRFSRGMGDWLQRRVLGQRGRFISTWRRSRGLA